ncbi:MAG TPA: bacterial Ig-like domain-containing protein [Oscillospiraceae bacterium]|nr:bacterial Ig-like domain-containing protein [Oscillospiraceae bacterium]
MKKVHRTCKKALSVILALTLMLTTFICFDIGALFGSAVDASSAITVSDNSASNVYFYAPEQIYLEPKITGYTTQDKYNYQWFVDSTVNNSTKLQTLRTGENSTGNFYFYYENASSVTVSYKYLTNSMTDMTAYTQTSQTSSGDYANANCNIKLAEYGTPLRAYNTSGTASYIYYTKAGNKIDTTITRESVSPYLAAKTKGYYIEWKATFVDKLDGQTKVAYAYTYVYKPYLQPVGTAINTNNYRGNNSHGYDISWISGIHSFNTSSTKATHSPNSTNGGKSLVTFSSSNPKGVQLGAAGTRLYAQFATQVVSNGNFFYTGMNNESAYNWVNGDGSPYLKAKSFHFVENKIDSSSKDVSQYTLATSPEAYLTVDVSRYHNLSNVPNLSAGLMVTSDEGSDNGAWYVADGTGKVDSSDEIIDLNHNNDTPARTLYNNYKTYMANQGDFDNRGSYEGEGVKYNGPVVIPISTTNGNVTYKVRAGYHNYQSKDRVTCIGVMPLVVTQTNKETLRDAMNHATNIVAKYGLKPDGTSVYYNSSNSNWTKFVNLYKVAGKMLAKLDLASTTSVSGYTLSTAVSNLNSAIAAIESEAKITSTATARFLALSKTANGYKLINVQDVETNSNVADVTKSFAYGQNVKFSAVDFAGYDYVGASAGLKAVDTETGADYSSLITTADRTINVNFANSTSNVQYTFLYIQKEYSTIVDTRGGDFNYLNIINSNFPSIGGMGYPTYAADMAVETDLNYEVSGNNVTAWTTESTTLAKYQFLPYVAEIEASTAYTLKYKVTGTDAANVRFAIYGANFTGGNGDTTSYYQFDGANSVITTNAVDSGNAYIRMELLGDARNGKKVMISDLCLTKADRNELYLNPTAEYPTNFVATSADKTGMSYTATGTSKLVVTSQYNSSTYDQKQLLPYYVVLKPNNTYIFSFDVEGVDASKVSFELVNSSFTGGNGSAPTTYSLPSSGSRIVVGTADDGAAQLKVSYAAGLAAGTKATITNLSITNLDTKTTITGKFSDLKTLGIPVREGYKFAGWTVKANDGSSKAYGSVTETIAGSLYQYKFGTGIDVVEAQWATDTCKVIFRNYDGTIISEQEVAYGSAANAPTTTPTRFGYTFNSWDTDFSSVTKDLIIEPVFDEINIDVILDKASVTVYEENEATVQASFNPNEPEISAVTWESENPAIATVTAQDGNKGLIKGISSGSTKITATVTYNGKTYSKSCTVTVTAKKVTAVEVVAQPTKTQYFVGEKFDPAGMQIQVTYNNGNKSDYSTYDFSSLPGSVTFATVSTATAGTKTVRLTYKEGTTSVSTTFRITVVAVKPTKIEFLNAPTKKFYVGDASSVFDPEGLEVHVTYNNGTTKDFDAADLEISYSGFDTTTAKTITMTGTYEGVSGTFNVVINPVELVSVAVKTMPNKTKYYVGDEFDQTGLTLTATYNNGKTETITNGITCTGFSSEAVGSKTVTASYGGKSTTFNVDIEAVKLVSIAVKTNPTKMSYYQGDALDSTGLTLTETYNNGKTETITTGFTCSALDSSSAGQKTITVTYQGLTTTFTVTVVAVNLVSVAVKTMPNKTSYFTGEAFDQTGLTLTATYNSGKTETISTGISCTGFSSATAGQKTITASYAGKSTTFTVEVKAIVPVSISIKKAPNKTEYFVGDSYDGTGLVVNVVYNNGTNKDITTGFTTSGFSSASAGKNTVTVSYEGFTATFDVTIKAVELTGIEIAKQPNKTTFNTGDELDTTGLVLTLKYNNGTTGTTDKGYTVSGYDTDTAGEQTITVTYQGFTATYKVTLNQSYADYKEVDAAIIEANKKIATGYYTDASVEVLNNSINAVVRNLKATEQETVNGYARDIIAKTAALVMKDADYSAVEAAKTAAKAKIEKGIYTDESVAALNAAIAAVVEGKKIEEQSVVDGYAAEIVAKTQALVEKPSDFSKIDALYTEISNYDPSLYTNYDEIYYVYIFDFYEVEVANAKAKYTGISQQGEVDKLYEKLVEYKNMLILKDQKVAKFELTNGAKYKTSGGVTYIVGLRTGLSDAALKNGYFVMENVTVTIKKAMGRSVGTGSTVTVKSTIDGSTIGQYVILIYGDLNGDGAITMLDSTLLSSSLKKAITLTPAQKLAANLNGDRYVNVVDNTLLNNVINKTAAINQQTGKAS